MCVTTRYTMYYEHRGKRGRLSYGIPLVASRTLITLMTLITRVTGCKLELQVGLVAMLGDLPCPSNSFKLSN